MVDVLMSSRVMARTSIVGLRWVFIPLIPRLPSGGYEQWCAILFRVVISSSSLVVPTPVVTVRAFGAFALTPLCAPYCLFKMPSIRQSRHEKAKGLA